MARYEIRKAGDWACYACNTSNKPVIFITGVGQEFYCAPCLMAAVAKGDIPVASDERCHNCWETIPNGRAYCESCYQAQGAGCENCGATNPESCAECSDSSCSNCGASWVEWCQECHECMAFCVECGDEIAPYCSEHHPCDSCGELTEAICDECRAPVEAAAAQGVQTADGTDFEFDDGLVVRWNE